MRAWLHDAIAASWWRRTGLLTLLLVPLSAVFYLLTTLRRLAYRFGILKTYHAKVPVIVVGNFTIGGTGKTPIVIALAHALQAKTYKSGIVSRGFLGDYSDIYEVTHESMPKDAGDEPILMQRATGARVMLSRERAAAAKALEGSVDVIISDDGLQHYALARDIEWTVTDSRRNGNGWLLPAGPLRELPRKVDALLVTGGTVNAGEWPIAQRQGTPYSAQNPTVTKDFSTFTTLRCAAVAGIGAPQKFFDALMAKGIKLKQTVALPDHFDYVDNPFAAINAEVIFITEKDAIKCASMDARLWVVPLQAELPEALIAQTLEQLVQLESLRSSTRKND